MEKLMDFPPQFAGGCKGIELSPRSPNDKHVIVTICVEDDDNWFRKDSFSSFWLDETIAKLQEARAWLEQNADKETFGWKFKD